MSITIELDGPGAAASPFARFSWTRAAVAWADEAGPMVRAALKHEAPVGKDGLDGRKGGRLRDSIRYERETSVGSLSMVFTANTPYAGYVIEGTGPHLIPKEPKPPGTALQFEFEGAVTYRRQVRHPGTRPNPFSERAVLPLAGELRASFAEAVRASAAGL